MSRAEALEEIARVAQLVSETYGGDQYYLLELKIALEELDRSTPGDAGRDAPILSPDRLT